MEKIELKCSNCGGALNKVEAQKDMYVCLHCGNKEIIKEEKNTTNYYINQNITKNIYGKENNSNSDYFKLIENAEKFIKLEDYKMAFKLIEQAKDIDPGHYLVWWLSAKVKILSNIKDKETGNFFTGPRYSIKNIEEDCKKSIAFASEEQRKLIEEEYQELCKEYSQYSEGSDVYVKETIGEEKPVSYVGFFVLLSLSFVYLVLGIVMPITEEESFLSFLSFFGGFLLVLALILWAKLKSDKKIISFIKTKEKVSFIELFDYCQESKIQIIEDIKKLKKRVVNLIENGNLVNYKIEKDFIIKV